MAKKCTKTYGIIFGTFRQYERTFHRYSERSTASIICTFGEFCSSELSFIDHATNCYGPRSVLQANLSNKINILSAYWHIHGTWTKTLFHRLNACALLARLPKMASMTASAYSEVHVFAIFLIVAQLLKCSYQI